MTDKYEVEDDHEAFQMVLDFVGYRYGGDEEAESTDSDDLEQTEDV